MDILLEIAPIIISLAALIVSLYSLHLNKKEKAARIAEKSRPLYIKEINMLQPIAYNDAMESDKKEQCFQKVYISENYSDVSCIKLNHLTNKDDCITVDNINEFVLKNTGDGIEKVFLIKMVILYNNGGHRTLEGDKNNPIIGQYLAPDAEYRMIYSEISNREIDTLCSLEKLKRLPTGQNSLACSLPPNFLSYSKLIMSIKVCLLESEYHYDLVLSIKDNRMIASREETKNYLSDTFFG